MLIQFNNHWLNCSHTYSMFKIFVVAGIAGAAILPGWAYSVKGKIDRNLIGNSSEIVIKVFDNDGHELAQTVADSKGTFLLDNIGEENIVVTAEGDDVLPLRIDLMTANEDTDLGTLSLEKVNTLDNLVVTADSRLNLPDKTIVYVTPTERERAANPFNMLTILAYKAPQIRVRESERTLTIEGETPEILVNGIRRPMAFISSINPENIEKIEFSTTSDLRFGRRYLNIITRRPPEGGWVAVDATAALTTPRYNLVGVGEYSRGKNDFMLLYNGGYRHSDKEYTDEEERYAGGGRELVVRQTGLPSVTSDMQHSIGVYFTRVPSDRSMLTASATLNIHDNDRDIYTTLTDAAQNVSDRYNHRGFSHIRPDLNLYYNLRASDRDLVEINAVGSFSHHDIHRDLTYSTGYDSRLRSDGDTWYFSAETVWKHQLPFAWLNTGVTAGHNRASSIYTIDGQTVSQSLYSTRMNAYTSISGNVITIGYNLSAGLSYYRTERDIVSPTVMAALQRSFGRYLTLSYNFRYNPGMPPVADYNQVATPVNDLMYHIGAAENLKAQHNITNRLQLQFNKDRLYVSLKSSVVSITNPLLYDYRYQDNPETPLYGYFLEMPANGRSMLSYGADCTAGISNLWNFLSISASTGWGHNRLKAIRDSYTVCGWYLDLNMALYWKGWQLNLTGENLTPAWSMQGASGKIRRWPYTSLALYKGFGHWNLHVAWNNLFSRYGGRYRTMTLNNTVSRTSDFRMGDQGNLVEIGVRYQFYAGKLLSKRSRSVNLSSEGENGVRWDY